MSLVLYQSNIYGFSATVVFCCKAQYEGKGYSISSTVTQQQGTTAAPYELVCQHPWLRYASGK